MQYLQGPKFKTSTKHNAEKKSLDHQIDQRSHYQSVC